MELNLKEDIKKLLNQKEYRTNGVHVSDITTYVINEHTDLFSSNELKDRDKLQTKINNILLSDVKKKIGNEFSKVRNSKTGKDKKGFYKIKNTRPTLPIDTKPAAPETPIIEEPLKVKPKKDNLFVGKAGECAVMSELLFRGYNVNQMMVDDGVDVVASKNNLFYFIQVKTTHTDVNNKIYASVKAKNFDAFIGTQIRYIIVARCNIAGIDTNLYFTFNNNDIQKYLFQEYINGSDSNLNIKIRIDRNKNNRPMLYNDSKETDITFHMNRFDL
jgi:Holliday junction resolvase-like predicted endonuclease